MREHILFWLTPSTEDPDLARQQRLLNLVLLGLAGPGFLFGLAMAVTWALGRTPITGALAGLGVQPFYLLAYWLGRRGRVRLAAYIPVIVLFLVMAGANWQLGVGHVVLVGYAMATLTAGILIGTGAALLFALLSMVAHLIIGMAQTAGRLPGAIAAEATVVADGIGLGLGLVVVVILSWLSGREMSRALRRERELSAELQAQRGVLEERVAKRTADLERRAVQLRAAAEVARDATAVPDVEELMRTTVKRISERFGFYHAGIFLVDEAGEYAVLRAASSEGGQRMLAHGHRLEVGEVGIVGWVAHSSQPRIALDVGDDAFFFDNPHLPLTRSEMGLPLKVRDRVIGVLDVQSTEAAAFSDEDVAVLRTLADQVALAIENARLLEESQRALREIQITHGEYVRTAWEGLETQPAFEYDRVEVKPVAPQLHHGIEQALSAGQVVAVIEREDGRPTLVALLRLRDQVIGAIGLEETDEARPWTAGEIELVEAVSEQVALALENARLFEEARAHAEELAVLNELGQALTARLDVEEVPNEAYVGASRLLDTTNFYVAFYDAEADGVSFPLAIEGGQQVQWRPRQMGQGLTEYIVRTQRPLLIQENMPEQMEKMGIELIGRPALSWLGVPLIVGDRVLGVMAVQSYTTPRAYNDHDRDLLTAIASQTAIALQNARLFEQAQRRARRERLIREITARVRTAVDIESMLQTTVQEVGKALGASHGLVRLGTEAELATPLVDGQADPDTGE